MWRRGYWVQRWQQQYGKNNAQWILKLKMF
jgi:hypothetical protein